MIADIPVTLEQIFNHPAQSGVTWNVPLLRKSSTISKTEMTKFSVISESWWDQNGQFRLLHQLNPVRIHYIQDKLATHFHRDLMSQQPFDGLSVLDIGCGGGLLSEPIARLGCSVTGIDTLKNNILVAQMHAFSSNLTINYRYTTVTQLAAESASFDIVLALEVAEHVENQPLFLATAAGLVAENGLMIVSTINRTLQSLLLAKVSAEYILCWLPVGTHDWRKFIQPSELVCWICQDNLLSILEMKGIQYTPILKKWLFSEDLAINYFAVAKRT